MGDRPTHPVARREIGDRLRSPAGKTRAARSERKLTMRDIWTSTKEPLIEGYETMVANFRWGVPETFNFGSDVIDRRPREHDGSALIWENAASDTRTYSYSDL